jgi:hypothetical protein
MGPRTLKLQKLLHSVEKSICETLEKNPMEHYKYGKEKLKI